MMNNNGSRAAGFRPLRAAIYLCAALTFVSAARADAPNQITYQGRLQENGALVNGSRTVEIELCDALTAGNCYSANPGGTSVTVSAGIFKLDFPVPTSVNLETGNWYLKLTVNGNAMSPRERLGSHPYAQVASSVAASGIRPGTIGTGVILPAGQVGTGVLGSGVTLGGGVTLPAGQVGTGTLSSGVILPAGQVGTGTLGANVILPAGQVGTGVLGSGVTLGGGVILPAGQVGTGVLGSGVTLLSAGQVGSGVLGTGVILAAGQVGTGVMGTDVILPAGQVGTGILGSGVILNAGQVGTGTLGANVILPAGQVGTGVLGSGVTLGGGVVLPAGQVGTGILGSGGTVLSAGQVGSGVLGGGVVLPAGQVGTGILGSGVTLLSAGQVGSGVLGTGVILPAGQVGTGILGSGVTLLSAGQVGTGVLGTGIHFADSMGIGTTNPTAMLHVFSNAANTAKIKVESSGSSGNPEIIVRANTPAGQASVVIDRADTGAPSDLQFNTGGSNDWRLRTSAGGSSLYVYNSALSPVMVFDQGGNVGVGATAPLSKLVVPGSVRLGAAGTGLWVSGSDKVGVGSTSPGTKLHLSSGVLTINGSGSGLAVGVVGTSLFVNSAGSVGVGTSLPSKDLDVMGTAQLHGGSGGTGLVVNGIGIVGVGVEGAGLSSRLQVAGGDLGLGDGTATGNQPITVWLTNQSGGARAAGDIVVAHSTIDNAFTTTTTGGDTTVIGVVYDSSISNLAVGRVAIAGVVPVRCGTGSVTRGQHVITSGTAGEATGIGSPSSGTSIGIWLEGGSCGGGTKRALLK